jgi:L-ascorbate peroxidase
MPTVGRRRAALVAVAAAAMPLLSALPDLSVFQSQETGFQALAALDESSTLELIQTELRKVISKGKAPGVLRLAFHDAGTFNITKLSGTLHTEGLFSIRLL